MALIGDGGLTMLIGELATIAKYDLPIKILVIKNNAFGEIKWEQLAVEGNPSFGVELQPIDFAAVARACGIGGYSFDEPQRANEVIGQAFTMPGLVLIEVVVDFNELLMSGQITTE